MGLSGIMDLWSKSYALNVDKPSIVTMGIMGYCVKSVLLAIPADFWQTGLMDNNLTWDEDLVWKGWTYSPTANRYYFDDIGNESLAAFWSDEFLNQAYL